MKKITEFIKSKKTLIAYFFAAGSGFVVQYLVGTTYCIGHLNVKPTTAYSIGFIASIPVGFVLSKVFAFKSRNSGNTTREMIKFGITLFFSYLITVNGSNYALKTLTIIFGELKTRNPFTNTDFSLIGTLSHFTGMGLSFIFNYFTHKKFTFVETGIFDKIREIKRNKA